MRLVSFLFEFIAASAVTAIIAPVVAVVVPRLEFLVVPFVVVVIVVTIIAAKRISPVVPVVSAALVGTEALHERSIGELQLSRRKSRQLLLNGVVVNRLFMPIVVR